MASKREQKKYSEALVPILVIEGDDDLLELKARLLDRKPAAHGPGGVGLVTDEELEHPNPSSQRKLGSPCGNVGRKKRETPAFAEVTVAY